MSSVFRVSAAQWTSASPCSTTRHFVNLNPHQHGIFGDTLSTIVTPKLTRNGQHDGPLCSPTRVAMSPDNGRAQKKRRHRTTIGASRNETIRGSGPVVVAERALAPERVPFGTEERHEGDMESQPKAGAKVPKGMSVVNERQREDIARLVQQLELIRRTAVELENGNIDLIEAADRRYWESARNLVHYMALRSHDLRKLQQALGPLGLSSLGRTEAHTMASLSAVLRVLEAMLVAYPPSLKRESQNAAPKWRYKAAREVLATELLGPGTEFQKGDDLLQRNTEDLLGPIPGRRKTHIMVTLPSEAADDSDLVRSLLLSGMSVARINCAHDQPSVWARIVAHVRECSEDLGQQCRILMDLGGPKLRTGSLQPEEGVVKLKVPKSSFGIPEGPARAWIAPPDIAPPDAPHATAGMAFIPVDAPEAWRSALGPGSRISFKDARGKERELVVTAREKGRGGVGEGIWAECSGSAYIKMGTELHLCGCKERDLLEKAKAIVGKGRKVGFDEVNTKQLSSKEVVLLGDSREKSVKGRAAVEGKEATEEAEKKTKEKGGKKGKGKKDKKGKVVLGRKVANQWRVAHVARLEPREIPIVLRAGDELRIVKGSEEGVAAKWEMGKEVEPARVSCALEQVFENVKVGEPIKLDDGKIEGFIEDVRSDEIRVHVTRAGAKGTELKGEKAINLPDSDLKLRGLTAKDLVDLDFIVDHADMVALSFANDADDVADLQAELRKRGADRLGIVLKIETKKGFQRLPWMLLQGMKSGNPLGVMIARGDMAVECGWERLAEVQEEVLWLCEAAHVPAIWATQVLEGLAKAGVPSRAEITDAAMGERAECVMLNKGPHIVLAVKTLDDILSRMQSHQLKKHSLLRQLQLSHPFVSALVTPSTECDSSVE
eukprot:TRINITY_DN9707_c0_g2_i1.p1 TRINITY_DN9707_c0_g2~~TRINITY_DN9707_c0_g2_i1.p1  ORF type:complete len:891 (-),score=155.96 TRINITY_DN9707_c0_g2_i1:824-3496(-)